MRRLRAPQGDGKPDTVVCLAAVPNPLAKARKRDFPVDKLRQRLGAGGVAQEAKDDRVGLPRLGRRRRPVAVAEKRKSPLGIAERIPAAAVTVADAGDDARKFGIGELRIVLPVEHLRREVALVHKFALDLLDVYRPEVAVRRTNGLCRA